MLFSNVKEDCTILSIYWPFIPCFLEQQYQQSRAYTTQVIGKLVIEKQMFHQQGAGKFIYLIPNQQTRITGFNIHYRFGFQAMR